MVKHKNIVLDLVMVGLLFLMVLLMLMITSCKHDPVILPNKPLVEEGTNENGNNGGESTCDPDSVYFETQVLPILISNCAKSGCHSVEDHKDGVILNNYANVMSTADVDPGRPGNSKVYEMITETDLDKRMPPAPNASLTNDQISLINRWIDQGARNNSCSNSCDMTNITFVGTIFPILQNSCIGCHSGSTPSGQIDLTTYQSVAAIAQTGKLYGAISRDAGFRPMPRGGNRLPQCQVDQVRIWIQDGMMNN